MEAEVRHSPENRFLLDGRKAELGRLLLDCQPWLAGVEGLMDADHRFSSELERIAGRLCEPFKVGVVGQFRSGKSSIINAFVGAEVALVHEVEATAAVSRYFHSDREVGRVVYSSSEAEETTIRDLIQMADLRRSDTAWLNRLERLESAVRAGFWSGSSFGTRPVWAARS
jgi:hypothetical protein